MKYFNSILDLVGDTPLVHLQSIAPNSKAIVLGKMETRNPGGSVKDRIGMAMLDAAVRDGKLKQGGTIIEATSGNTGIGLALVAAIKGYKAVFVMTDKASVEKVRYLKALGAEVVVTTSQAKPETPEHYVTIARRLAHEIPNSFHIDQYNNPANPDAHYHTTGPEIWNDTEGTITHFISGMGTGGSISGTARYLKEKNPKVHVVGADPIGSALKGYFDTGRLMPAAPYLVEGVGQEIIPGNLHFKYIDEVISVSDKDSFAMARHVARHEGIFVGGSTGMNLVAAERIARAAKEGDVIVVIICDTGERYLSKHHSDEWLKEKQLLPAESLTLAIVLATKQKTSLATLISVSPSQTVADALSLMDQHGLSQIPVLDETSSSVGSLRENRLLTLVLDDRKTLEKNVGSVMEKSFPILPDTSEVKSAVRFLKDSPALLVSEYNRIVGIVTRHDLLEYV